MELRMSTLLTNSYLCLALLLLNPSVGKSQYQLSYADLKQYSEYKHSNKKSFRINLFYKNLKTTAAINQSSKPAYPLLPQWTPADLPLFCKIEYHLDKVLPIPIRFRLGSVDYVNWLEQKTGY